MLILFPSTVTGLNIRTDSSVQTLAPSRVTTARWQHFYCRYKQLIFLTLVGLKFEQCDNANVMSCHLSVLGNRLSCYSLCCGHKKETYLGKWFPSLTCRQKLTFPSNVLQIRSRPHTQTHTRTQKKTTSGKFFLLNFWFPLFYAMDKMEKHIKNKWLSTGLDWSTTMMAKKRSVCVCARAI